ncbi:type I restriction enzyme subunit R domain-containing protein [Burkholderia cenocepacia]|uniref:type I restriction enzyme subunit R domain-containing protein n=1 Tax=Burkholderia cenocepacia TaxID=95486 RepID=UPI002AB251F6|nr:DEAD/DEAH box helicase family protein [Burkholderia cenocepacia]
MAQGFKESDFQNSVFVPYLTAAEPEGLEWILGKPTDIDAARWIVPGDLLYFLRDGSALNAAAYAKAIKGYDSDAAFLRAFLVETLLPKIESKANATFILRESLTFAGQSFILWNEAPRAGAGSGAEDLFKRNCLRVIPEATFERWFPYSDRKIRRRPDLVFFVNGLYLAYSELKTAQTGQTAAGHGRNKIAHDCVEAGIAALREARERYTAEGGRWPGFRHRDLSEKVRWEIRQSICLYEKATHISCADMGAMMVLQDLEWLLPEIDDAIEIDDAQALVETLPAKVVDAFMRTADMRDKPASEALANHLASFFAHADGVDREIHFFNQNRPSRTTTGGDILRPRPAQRAMLFQTIKRVRELYADEAKSKVNEPDIRAALALSLPDLDARKADEIVRKTLLHRNGQESHSILLQGAAGLGKTNVIVWLAQALVDLVDPTSMAAAPLFDQCILLTDRTELRRNVAEEAARLRATQNIVAEAETFKDLRDCLQGGARVVVVNIQKFPSIKRLADADPVLSKLLRAKRVAFVIDEVHRTQNGVLHDATIEIFDEWGTVRPDGAKRNLIVGLTATPRDEILARFGEWRSPAAAGDDIRWAPYFAYTMTQAIRDRVILNPIQNVIRFEDHLQYRIIESVSKLHGNGVLRPPSSDEIYQNPSRQMLVAKQAALVFVAKTIMAIRPPGRTLGEGKAMFAAHSIKAAIAYQKLLRTELDVLASDPRFAEYADSIRACPVLLLYTDKQGEPSCASLNNGRDQDAVIDEFRRKGEGSKQSLKVYNSIIIVVDKLLTGFDEPTLHTIFIDRGMDDVLLFQAACRINRWRKWKSDCLLVDLSHEGIVSKNLPKVFAKYGGITVSDLDAMTLKEKMEKAFSAFFDDKDINQHWRSWRATYAGATELEGATALSDFLDSVTAEDPPRATLLRKVGSAWLSSRERLWGILDFKKPELSKHASEQRAAFAEQVVKHLAVKLRDEDARVGAVFDIDLVEDSVGWALDELPEAEEKKKVKSEAGLPHSIAALMATLDAIELLAALQLTEQQKLVLIEKLKAFLITLFQVIGDEGKRRNNDIHRKMILAMAKDGVDFPWEDRYAKFKDLLNAGALNLRIFSHPDRKAMLPPLVKRPELVMADYEEWIVSGGDSIKRGPPTIVDGTVNTLPDKKDTTNIDAAMLASGEFLLQQLGADPKWQRFNKAIWSSIQSSAMKALQLTDLREIAACNHWERSELLAVVALLGTPNRGTLRMELRSADGTEVVPEEIAGNLASWWKGKTMSDDSWRTWASQVDVYWVPADPEGGL